MKKQHGFSLIELLIVVAIILIIAAIAIPNLLRSRIAANEASAVGSIRSLNTAQASQKISTNSYATLTGLGPGSANLIDNQLASGTKSGYSFNVADVTADTYQSTGEPTAALQSGIRSFCSDQSGVIHFDGTAPSTAGTGASCLARLAAGTNALQ